MPDKKYSVDDILRELNQKQSAPEQRPAAPQEDSWQPVQQQPPRRAPAPQQYPTQPQRPQVQQPSQQRPAPQREIPRREQEPRLGQQPQRPRTRDEMNSLIGNFSDRSEDPLGDLDFLERETSDDFFGGSGSPASAFVPDWDKQQRQQQRQPVAPPPPPSPPRQQRSVAPQGSWQQPAAQEGSPAPPPQRAQGHYPQPPSRALQSGGRRSMADAARLITGGGIEDFPENTAQPAQRQRQQPAQRPMQRPAQQARPGRQPGGEDYFDAAPPPVQRPAQQARPSRQPGGEDFFDAAPPPVQRPAQQARPSRQPGREDFFDATPQQPVQRPRQQATSLPQQEEVFFNPASQQPRPARSMAPPPRVAPPPATLQQDPVQSRRQRLEQLDTDDMQPPVARQQPARRTAPPQDIPQEREEEQVVQPPHTGRRGGHESVQQVSDELNRMRTGLLLRTVVNILVVAAVIYLVLAGNYELPLPDFLLPTQNASMFLWSGVLLVSVSAIVSGNTVGGGIMALLKLRPSNDSYAALAVFACLVQAAYMAMQPDLLAVYGDNLYLPIAALVLLFNTLGKLIMLSRMCGSFHILSAKGSKQFASIMDNRDFAKRIAADIIGEEPNLIYAAQTTAVEGFLEHAFSESKAEDISRIIAPMTALAALVMALVSYLFSSNIFTAACVYTAALCITAPLAGVIASNLPLSITNGKLARWNATLCGYDAVNQFATANGVVLRASQLFPKGSVTVQDIQVLDRRPIDQVIVDVASVLCSCDSYLAPVFGEMIQDASMLHVAENIEFVDGMGVSAWVAGRRVLIGSRNMLLSYGVIVSDSDYERQLAASGAELLYLANSGEASAVYVLNFKPDKAMRRSLELVCESDMGVCVYSNDPTLTEKKISAVYGFPEELLTIIPVPMHPGAERYLRPVKSANAAVLHNGSPASYLRTILAARSCNRCIALEMALILMSVVLGFGIVTFFAFTQNMGALTWVTLAVFQFFWLLLELVVPLFKH